MNRNNKRTNTFSGQLFPLLALISCQQCDVNNEMLVTVTNVSNMKRSNRKYELLPSKLFGIRG